MNTAETIVLIHGSANGSYSWGPVVSRLKREAVAPDMLGYGTSPAPSPAWGYVEETAHLKRQVPPGRIHLVAHSMGVTFALYLLRALPTRVTRLTLIDPIVVSVLRETGEREAFEEMEGAYQRFITAPNARAAAQGFVDHWGGKGSWDRTGDKARSVITSLVPRLRLEVSTARADTTPLRELAPVVPPTEILVGERTRLAPKAVTRQLAKAFGATTIVVRGAGHMIPLTHPAAIVAALSETKELSSWQSSKEK
jgi:pimeloyl-ACP methyl ester carboxylesterase